MLRGRRRLCQGVVATGWLGTAAVGRAQSAPLVVAVDAEFGLATSTSAQAIERGAQIAADEINQAGGLLGGRMLAVQRLDNRGVPMRAVQHTRELAGRDDVLAMLTGRFSPAVLEASHVAQQLKLPLLAPWSAADDIVDRQPQPSWVFRLSVRDEWAIDGMLRRALAVGATRVGLLLPNNAWGRSSQAAARRRVATAGGPTLVGVEGFNIGDTSHAAAYRRLRASGAQALLLVANEPEGAALVNEMAALPPAERLPVISHWGVTGGRFFALAEAALQAVDFCVVQTYSFIGADDPVARRVLAALRQRGVADVRRLDSPVGVAHAYDLVQLLAAAVQRAGSDDRSRVRDALERLRNHQGLVRLYREPFTPARHEALDASAVFFARYHRDGALVRTSRR